jgi:hypothetical protein
MVESSGLTAYMTLILTSCGSRPSLFASANRGRGPSSTFLSFQYLRNATLEYGKSRMLVVISGLHSLRSFRSQNSGSIAMTVSFTFGGRKGAHSLGNVWDLTWELLRPIPTRSPLSLRYATSSSLKNALTSSSHLACAWDLSL